MHYGSVIWTETQVNMAPWSALVGLAESGQDAGNSMHLPGEGAWAACPSGRRTIFGDRGGGPQCAVGERQGDG